MFEAGQQSATAWENARRLTMALLGATALTPVAASLALAQTTWTGASSTNWFTPGNWNPAGPPTSSNSAVVDNGSTANPAVINSAGAAASDLTIGSSVGATGAVSITGSGSLTTGVSNNGLAVGDWGNGTLTVSSGGTLTSSFAVLGNNAGSTGSVLVTGAGSSWTAGGYLYVAADHSVANITVSNGGMLTSSIVDVADFSPSASGTVTVTGAGSSYTNTQSFALGTLGAGVFNVTNGATANLTGGFGIGSYQGSGSFNVLSGGSVTSSNTGAVYIGSATSTGAAATVSGVGSTWTISGAFNGDALDVAGGASTATFTISNGGQVVVSPTAGGFGSGNVTIGGAGNVNAAMLVDGAGSTFTSPTNLTIGAVGTASLTISNGGAVNLTGAGSTLSLGGVAGSSGALNIGAAPGSAAVAPGTLNAGNVVFATTTSAINFNHTSANYTFAPPIIGQGQVNFLAGTTIFAINETYSGTTTISPGATLQLGNGGATGAVVTNIVDNGFLVINHSTAFPWSFQPYQNVLSGAGVVSLTGGGTLNLNGDSSGFAGTTLINNGMLNIAADTNGVGKLGGVAVDIGVNAGDNGAVSVYNVPFPSPSSGATLAISGRLTIGDAGTGSLGVSDGATVSDGSAVIGAQAGSSGSATAGGSGATWTTTGVLGVGLGGSGYLSIGSSSTVSDASAYIGQNSGSSGKVILAGTGAQWNNTGVVTIAAQTGSTGVLDIGAPVGINP